MPQPPRQQDDQRANVQLRIESDLIEVAPGNAESTSFTVKNLGTQVEHFRCIVTGAEWVVAEPATLTVYPGEEATGTIQANPPRKPGFVAGVTPFQLTVTSVLHAHVSSSVAGRVDVAPYYELAAELVPTSSNGRGLTRHHIALDNRGNVPLRIALSPTDVTDGLRLGVPAFADVAPGQVIEVPVSVYGTRRWFGRPEPKTFSVVAEPPKPLAATRLSGTRILAPLFPRWVPVAAAGLVVAAAAAVIVVPKLTAHAVGSSQQPSTGPATTGSTGPGTTGSTGPGTTGSTGPGTTGSTGPATTGSTGPATTASTSAPVPVPEVTGETLDQADADISGKNLKPQPQASWVSPSAVALNVARTEPTAGASASPGSTVEVFVPTGTYGLMPVSQSADWTATSQFQPPFIGLTFGGKETDNTGAALMTGPVTLESGDVLTQTLETHPPPLTNGFIKGVYKLPRATIESEQFRADIGFRQNTGGSIQYQVIAIGENGSPLTQVNGTHQAGTGLTPVKVTLPAGTTKIALVVTALDSSPANDDLVWVNPRIEEANAPAEPLQPTPTASP